MNPLFGMSPSELWEHVAYHRSAAREFIVCLSPAGPLVELVRVMEARGIPKQLCMHPLVLRAFDEHLHVVDRRIVPSLSKYLPPKLGDYAMLGLKVNTDDKLSCPVSPGRIVLDSIERYGVSE